MRTKPNMNFSNNIGLEQNVVQDNGTDNTSDDSNGAECKARLDSLEICDTTPVTSMDNLDTCSEKKGGGRLECDVGTLEAEHGGLSGSGTVMNENNVDNRKVVGIQRNDCEVNKRTGYCSKHECVTKKTVVTSKVWKWKPKINVYGYVSVRRTKYICKRLATSSLATVGDDDLVQLENQSTEGVGNNGSIHVSGRLNLKRESLGDRSQNENEIPD